MYNSQQKVSLRPCYCYRKIVYSSEYVLTEVGRVSLYGISSFQQSYARGRMSPSKSQIFTNVPYILKAEVSLSKDQNSAELWE